VAQFPTERMYLSVFKAPLTPLGSTQPSFQLLLRDNSQMVKTFLRETNYLLISNAEFKNAWRFSSTHAYRAHENFSFTETRDTECSGTVCKCLLNDRISDLSVYLQIQTQADFEELDVVRDVAFTLNLITYITGTYVWHIFMRQKISVSFPQNKLL
jgi:hypothetical protein